MAALQQPFRLRQLVLSADEAGQRLSALARNFGDVSAGG
jgi:hypothetical protein